jgi:Calcineurin-like phosphoesterase
MHRTSVAAVVLLVLAWPPSDPAAQQGAAPPPVVKPIEPPATGLPAEGASAGIKRFAFIAYGDTRGPADGIILQPQHSAVVDAILAAVTTERAAGFPVRFVLQSGDAVANGREAAQWNISFTPVIERLTRGGGLPYFFAVGNHDVGGQPVGDPDRERGLRSVMAAMSKVWPPEGSPRRLDGYPTFAFGYGHMFFIAFDSNIAADPVQLGWVSAQLAQLDRQRFPIVVAFFHHPPLTTGVHGGPVVERESEAIRRLYLPLFRRYHVRLTIAGHDHLYDHFIEHYDDLEGTHRMDHIVSGGGGAPIYTYRGEQDLARYRAAAAPQHVVVEHAVRPGSVDADNPHHFVIFEVDGDRIWLKIVATVARPFLPYGQDRIELADKQP